MQIHVVRTDDRSALPDLVKEVERDDDGEGEVDGEEVLDELAGRHFAVADGCETGPELGDQDENVEDEADPRADDTRLAAESKLVQRVALSLPALAEADVGEADGHPGEDGRQTGDGKHPGKSLVLNHGVGGEESKETEDGGEADADHGTALAVNVGEDPGSLALLGKSSKSTGRTVDRGVTNRQDSNHDDNVHDGRQHVNASVLDGNDEGRGGGIGRRVTIQETRVVVRDKQTNDGKGNDVEEGDTPEDLLDSGGQGLARVGSLSSGETDQLGTGESEGGSDENAAKTLEAVVERSGIPPVLVANVAALGTTTDVQDDTEDDETDDGDDLDDGEDEFGLTITLHTEQIDGNNDDEENGNPGGVVDLALVPVVDGNRGSDDLERQDNQPLQGVVPAHGETPCRVDEASRICGEGTGDGEQDGHLTQSVDGAVQHDADQTEGDQERSGASVGQGLAGADEQTGTCQGGLAGMFAREHACRRRRSDQRRREWRDEHIPMEPPMAIICK